MRNKACFFSLKGEPSEKQKRFFMAKGKFVAYGGAVAAENPGRFGVSFCSCVCVSRGCPLC